MKENPFLHYRLKAAELGINERDLIDWITIGGDEGWLAVECENVKLHQDCIPRIIYHSKINNDNLSILATTKLYITRQNRIIEFDNIEKLFELDYSFAINGQHPDGSHDYIGITVSDFKIIKPKIKLDKIKGFPEEFFHINTNYVPALYWMLEKYAEGLK